MYQELEVWQRAMELVTLVYRLTADFPEREKFGLTNQLRRAAVAVPSNVAEGQGRRTTKDFLSFLSISRGSLQEVETQIEIARRLNYLPDEQASQVLDLAGTVGRLLNGLMSALNRKLS
jgi:four helix bundle protein